MSKTSPSTAGDRIVPVILSGGSGTRLWPLSRTGYPKQFLGITQEQTLFQLTLARLEAFTGLDAPLIVGNENHRFILGEQLQSLGVRPQAILLEPAARNTAPAIAAAAFAAMAHGADPLLLVLAADHVVEDVDAFCQAVQAGVPAARAGSLVTFGIVPSAPETGYGYIEVDAFAADGGACDVAGFVEKPDLATAQAYLAGGRHLWNSGMFLFRASVVLAELERFSPTVTAAAREAVGKARADLDFLRLDKAAFSASPDDSIDYAVMEKSDKVKVVPMSAGWSDVGAWRAVWEVAAKDANGNAVRGDVLLHGSSDCYVRSDHRLVAAIGLQDVMIVETSDAILVAAKHAVQDVKKVVDRLKAQKRPEANLHREVFRPWGSYDSIDQAERYQVKRITVKPGQKLSVQMHHHRAEHWIVVSGTALVAVGDKEVMLTENQSTYIPVGVIHSLENPGKIPLELIEVQSGAYLGEDDIVRFADIYGRAPVTASATPA
ncbi:mannose-1-phosphate guanylyltransferase/mannose-6-phosphate isomerase [Xylophilus sp. GOD-11R]|uniref:mannose-1-phosphate guanylyltransferase/mannose-6-phosphate isomerase n=1 Tax=Xylophilus sp. GOD-11R TaxID=3089814 RepID=UPI00298D5FA5|nr:mannose-1-phosphate guanylyltransferase/mannose-6-phosphate isomerase [Xylophilus sp. GOD-11R]WPB55490.1 mannose-1-phosphate guanylyltransferase/mannose-6-phosphate isomerase [Xylophilus sp. GOD-11R]